MLQAAANVFPGAHLPTVMDSNLLKPHVSNSKTQRNECLEKAQLPGELQTWPGLTSENGVVITMTFWY